MLLEVFQCCLCRGVTGVGIAVVGLGAVGVQCLQAALCSLGHVWVPVAVITCHSHTLSALYAGEVATLLNQQNLFSISLSQE